MPEQARQAGIGADLILQTLRSHDQYNTTLYDDATAASGDARGGVRQPADIQRLGLEAGQQVDLVSLWDDGIERRVSGFTLLAYDTAGSAAAYYRKPTRWCRWKALARAAAPTSKFIAIRVLPDTRTTEQQLIASGQ